MRLQRGTQLLETLRIRDLRDLTVDQRLARLTRRRRPQIQDPSILRASHMQDGVDEAADQELL